MTLNKMCLSSNIFIYLLVSLQARQPGGADLFICYAGVQMREAVAAKADWVVIDFQELISELP